MYVPVAPARIVPPKGVAYQSIVSFILKPAEAEIVTDPNPHRELSVPTAGLGIRLIIACTAVLEGTHPEADVTSA